MAEIRVQIAYHFKIDPAKESTPPEQITRTISVGEEFTTEKVNCNEIKFEDRGLLQAEIDKVCREATRTARPVADDKAAAEPAHQEEEEQQDEISAF